MSYDQEFMRKFRADNDTCAACGSQEGIHCEHIKTVASGGTNEPHNTMPICFFCHTLKGQKGIKYMADNFPKYRRWLILNGWTFDVIRDKWAHYNKPGNPGENITG